MQNEYALDHNIKIANTLAAAATAAIPKPAKFRSGAP